MSYLIKERMMRDKSSQGDSVRTADSAVAIGKNFSVKKKGRIEEPASFETKMKTMEVAAYPHFPADNIAEVWLSIFEKLDAEDKITFSKTCQELHDWVASKRTCFHFSEVVPVLLTETTIISKGELLRCRTMCKSWTSDFNCVYLAHPSHLLLETEKDGVEENEIIKLENHFTSTQQIQRFLEEMYSHKGNPFPGRSIRLEFELPGEAMGGRTAECLREYCEKTIELLEMFGVHVYMVMFDLWDHDYHPFNELEPVDTYIYFSRLLLHMPNLRKLVVEGHQDWNYCEEDLPFYGLNTLPKLPHLEAVSMNRTCHAICNGVLESSCVPLIVKRLSFYPAPGDMEHLRIPEVTYFPNLEAFKVRLSGEYLERFLNVLEEAIVPPVVHIELLDCQDEQDFGRLFRSLETFARTLTCLKLCIGFTDESLRHAIATEFSISLPQLERLELDHFNGPLDPFCQLPSLKVLKIYCSQFRQWDGSKVDFYGLGNRMEESNIWEKIPSLQEFHFGSYRWSRHVRHYHRNMLKLSPSE